MTSGTRLPTWKERENNKRRERRRRAIAAKIFAGLRLYGNYKLPKHCDNNEVLKALCAEAGWTVDEDGSTYRKVSKLSITSLCSLLPRLGLNGDVQCIQLIVYLLACFPLQGSKPPPADRMDMCPSPSEVSPASSYPGNDGASLIPWLKGLSSGATTPTSSATGGLPPLHTIHGGSSSAPVTPPLSSPTGRGPPVKPDWDLMKDGHPEHCSAFVSPWNHHPFLAAAAAAAHLRPGYCDTPDGARTPVEEAAMDSEVSPGTALEFATVCGANSSKWANGVRVRTGSGGLPLSGRAQRGSPNMPALGPFPASDFSHPWRNPMQKSISMPVSPVSSRMKGSFGERLGRCPSELELSGGLGSLWEIDAGASHHVGAKRKLPADDLELTLGSSSSSLRAMSEQPRA